MAVLGHGVATNVGCVRTNNEDSFLARPDLQLWLVADGMGGHEAGEVASSIVTDFVETSIEKGSSLSSAIYNSHYAVIESAERGIGGMGMGSTAVALRNFGAQYEIAWVGDSRAYLWDGTQIHQLTTDHSYVQLLLESGAISAEEAIDHPQKNVITQSLGVTDLKEVTVDTVYGTWKAGHKVILCSDGLNDELSDHDIARIMRKHLGDGNEQAAVDELIDKALDNGGSDNVTVAVISAPTRLTVGEKLHKAVMNTPLAPLFANIGDRIRVFVILLLALALAGIFMVLR